MRFSFFSFFLIIFFILNVTIAKELTFDTQQIEILDDGKTITALNGTAKSVEDNLEIIANKFIYNKDLLTLKVFDDITLKNTEHQITIKAKKLFYDLGKKILFSDKDSEIQDKFGNLYLVDNFNYEIEKDLVKINGVKIVDKEMNILNLEKAFINLNSKKLIAKDVSAKLSDIFQSNNGNNRLKGNSLIFENDTSTITKGVFTTCKKTDTCPPWQMTAKKIIHNKKNKTIYYQNAWLKIYDRPVFYFPKFFHPDPSVKRRSGFLMPSSSDSSSTGTSINTPYYFVLADNKDLTIKPRIYFQDKQLLQAEYREINKNSTFKSDLSLLNNSSNNRNHFFSNYTKYLDLNAFEDSKLNLQIQKVSGDTYLKTYKLNSPLIKDANRLTSSLDFSAYSDDLALKVDFKVYENLSLENNDRYEFVYPSYQLNKKVLKENNFNGNFNFNSNGYAKHSETNKFSKAIINNLNYTSNASITESGLKNNFNIFLKNVNSHTKKPSTYVDNKTYKGTSLFEYNTSFPLKKENNKNKSILIPKTSFKYSPNDTKEMRDEDSRIDVGNIFSTTRTGASDSFEGGASFTYGTEFQKIDDAEREYLNIKIANSLRLEKDNKLPVKSTVGEKMSDIVGGVDYNPSDNFNIKYNFSIDENLSDHNYQLIKTTMEINNFITSFEYLNENYSNLTDNNSYLDNRTSYVIDDEKELSFSTRRNKKTSLTEFYNLIYKYRNDCLTASIEYNKDYYEDRSLRPEENIFFKLTIVPFGETQSPDLLN